MLCEHARKATTVVPKRYRHLSKVPKRCPARTVASTRLKEEVLLVLLIVEAAVRVHSLLGEVLASIAVTSKKVF